MRVAPEPDSRNGHSVTFVLATGTVRQTCRLQTTFATQNQAFNYLRKHRKQFERLARECSHYAAAISRTSSVPRALA